MSVLIFRNLGNVSKALTSIKYIYDSLNVKTKDLFNELIILRMYNNQFSIALDEIETYGNKYCTFFIEDQLYLRSLKIMVLSKFDTKRLFDELNSSKIAFSTKQFPKTIMVAKSFHRIGEFIAPLSPEYSIDFLNSSIKIYKELNATEISKCYHDLGLAYYYNKNYEKAAKNIELAIIGYSPDRLSDIWLIINAKIVLGLSYHLLSRTRDGNRELMKAFSEIKKLKSYMEYCRLSFIVTDQFIEHKEFKQALKTLKSLGRIIPLLVKSKEREMLKYAVLVKKGYIYYNNQDPKCGYKYYSQSQELWSSLKNKNAFECNVNIQNLSTWCSFLENTNPKEFFIIAHEIQKIKNNCN